MDNINGIKEEKMYGEGFPNIGKTLEVTTMEKTGSVFISNELVFADFSKISTEVYIPGCACGEAYVFTFFHCSARRTFYRWVSVKDVRAKQERMFGR